MNTVMNFTSFSLASTEARINTTNQFKNLSANEVLSRLKEPKIGLKDGSHFIRTALNIENNFVLPRSDSNAQSMANILILDCDKRINITSGIEIEGAPSPEVIHSILKANNIAHILYGSYSHYEGSKGNRYRIAILTNSPYTKEELAPTLEELITLINVNLQNELLCDAIENRTWSQGWYYPRKPATSTIDTLYFEFLEGQPITVSQKYELPTQDKTKARETHYTEGQISPIDAFNLEHNIADILHKYKYKRVYSRNDFEKWLSPNSSTGRAGITLKNKKVFSHHSDVLNDGFWHDAFDVMKLCEGLSENDAIKKAAQLTRAPDGRTVDEYNKSNFKKPEEKISSTTIYSKILNQLIDKIKPVDFRKTANITKESDKLKLYHFYVIVIENILQLAKKNNFGLCRNHDFIYIFNGEYWNCINEDELKLFLGIAAEKMTVDKFSARYFNFRDQLFKQFLASAYLPKPELPNDTVFINLKNGTFEITPTGNRLKPFDANDFITYQLPFEYKSSANCPQFQAYLDRVLPDKSLHKILSEYLGYLFIRTSTLKLEKALLLYGKGANGKSVFYEIVRKLLGEINISEYSLQTLTDDSGYSRAMICNKLLNYATEISGKLGMAVFKQLVSGEPVEARLPYGDPFIMTDYGKLIFNCNELPRDIEQTEAYFRRLLIIPFNVTIPEYEQDKQLAQKIIDTELSGVFNWVLDGLNRLLNQKEFTYSKAVYETRSQYEIESDSVKLFLEEMNYTSHASNWVLMKKIYSEYRTFCTDNGYRPVASLNFRKRLESAKVIIERKNDGNVAFLSKENSYNQVKWGE